MEGTKVHEKMLNIFKPQRNIIIYLRDYQKFLTERKKGKLTKLSAAEDAE